MLMFIRRNLSQQFRVGHVTWRIFYILPMNFKVSVVKGLFNVRGLESTQGDGIKSSLETQDLSRFAGGGPCGHVWLPDAHEEPSGRLQDAWWRPRNVGWRVDTRIPLETGNHSHSLHSLDAFFSWKICWIGPVFICFHGKIHGNSCRFSFKPFHIDTGFEMTMGPWAISSRGETDMRGCYCAIATASMLHILSDELLEGVPEYISRCQTWEGGIAGEEGLEDLGNLGIWHCLILLAWPLGVQTGRDAERWWRYLWCFILPGMRIEPSMMSWCFEMGGWSKLKV